MIDKSRIRTLHLSRQFLLQKSNTSIYDIIKKIGYVQIDAIYTTARAHDITLHARSNKYTEEYVWKMLERGEVFEYMAHARSIIPIDHFPYYYSNMIDYRDKKNELTKFIDKYPKLVSNIIEFIDNNGPSSVSDIEMPTENLKSRWSSTSKRILDHLFLKGYITVAKRVGFKPYFDLLEKVVRIPDELPGPMERFWFHVSSTIEANGPSSIERILHYKKIQSKFKYGSVDIKPRDLLKQWIKDGKLIEIKIKDNKIPYYDLKEYEQADIPYVSKPQTVFLSPFDNILWSRKATLEQYDFDYKIEIYTPVDKRKFGYYVMPILYYNRLVGRVDVKFDRQVKKLQFIRWFWEKHFKPDANFVNSLRDAINKLALFHNADSVTLGDMKDTLKKKIST